MTLEQIAWTEASGWDPAAPPRLREAAELALVFGSTAALSRQDLLAQVRGFYPRAQLFGCSTAGEILGTTVTDDGLVVTAIRFERSTFRIAAIRLDELGDSLRAGALLAHGLEKKDLRHVIVLSDGLRVNGSDLVKGLARELPAGVTVTGGLAADGERFRDTRVLLGDRAEKDVVAGLAIHGDRVKVGHGSLGGWDPFGPERLITRSRRNVLYDLDGKSALALYKRYLGDHASGLPATGLLFPLSVRPGDAGTSVVRTILSVDEREGSMTFAGDVPEGAWARLMKANSDRLIDGATGAARASAAGTGGPAPELAICISCVGRRLVLKQRTEEELEGVRDVMGAATVLTGFYSYGEISPVGPALDCALHNQTMTVTSMTET